MNKTFTIIDKINNVQRMATKIVKFTIDNKDYIIYSVDENEENRQIFVSRFIVNTEGKYFIETIAPEEKAKLSDIVYNIIILTPTNYKKGENATTLLNNLKEKFKITLANDNSELGMQEYYSNCSIAITSKELVTLAIDFFEVNLKEPIIETTEKISVPTWNIPSNDAIEVQKVAEEPVMAAPTASAPVVEPVVPVTVGNTVEPIPNVQPNIIPEIKPIPEPVIEPAAVPITENVATKDEVLPGNTVNPQVAVVSDPSLANATGVNMQPNVMKLNNKGKANVKYIIIGTACILLAIAVVIVAYILIQQKTTGV